MRRPQKRSEIPPRNSDHDGRRLAALTNPNTVPLHYRNVRYEGSSKHKRHPHLFELEPFRGDRGDRTLCDDHASFSWADRGRIPKLISRGLSAQLVGTRIWTIDDNGWIYELSVTNSVAELYHGYPIRPSEAIAKIVYKRFDAWASQHGTEADKNAAAACKSRYRF